MANTFTTTSTTGFLSRIINSFFGIILGLALFIGSFFLLYWNEGRFDTSILARTAVEVNSQTAADTALSGKLVSTTGTLVSSQMVGDNMFFTPGNYIAVKRTAEMYSWIEEKSSTSHDNLGGSQTTQTTYTYKTEWTENPPDSANFQNPADHTNPTEAIKSDVVRTQSANLGIYSLDMKSVDLPNFSKITLTPSQISAANGVNLADSTYLFSGRGSMTGPQVGDERISYSVVNSGINATVFGQLNGSTIYPYYDAKEHRLYRIFDGTRNTAIFTLHNEYSQLTWILRAVGFFAMWFGMMMVLGPVSVILSFFPFFGSLSRAILGAVTFLIAVVLTGATIIISMIFHNPVVLAVTILVILVVIFAIAQRRRTTGAF